MINLHTHDSFCRDVLADVPTFLEFVGYLSSQNPDLEKIVNLLDMDTLVRIPGDFSDTTNTGYANLVFRADVKRVYLQGANPVQVCVGFLLEHKSTRDDKVLEQLRRYHYHMMVEKFKENAARGIPSVAIILYNGIEKWNPLEKLDSYPAELRDIMLPFKCIFMDVDSVDDKVCIEQLSPRLGAFIIAMKYARNPESHKGTFKKMLERIGTPNLADGTLDLLTSIDVYLHKFLSENFKENFSMDFVRPPYKTIADAEREEREALEKQRDALKNEKDILEKQNDDLEKQNGVLVKRLADKNKENAAKDAEITRLKAALAEKQN